MFLVAAVQKLKNDQIHKETDMTEIITCPHTRMVNNLIS